MDNDPNKAEMTQMLAAARKAYVPNHRGLPIGKSECGDYPCRRFRGGLLLADHS
jgi:hypothetical protein